MLTEIAVLDHHGQLLYEAFVQKVHPQAKQLEEILQHFLTLAQGKQIICHYAQHDIQLLKTSFEYMGHPWPPLYFQCTWELAKTHFPQLRSYTLDYLSRYFNLRVHQHYFSSDFAHSAKYDAEFTYQLYMKIMATSEFSSHHPNPFGTSRVDTPFQKHPDSISVFQGEFETIKSILMDIKQDSNHQSRGLLILGEAGSGKTHLMMRVARELLHNHRLLFIRQPNHPEAVLHHIYSRILESLVEVVPQSPYSQLEFLLAKSFSKIVTEFIQRKEHPSAKEREFVNILSANPLNIYNELGNEGTDKKRKNWQFLEKRTVEWWNQSYGFAGYSPLMVKGLIKFCSYSDSLKRELVRRWLAGNELDEEDVQRIQLERWGDQSCQENFSLEAMTVFGKLSIVDEPLIIVFDQLEGLIYHEALLIRFGEAVKEMFTHIPNSLMIFIVFPERWKEFKAVINESVIDRISQYQIFLEKPSHAQLHTILSSRTGELDIGQFFTPTELQTILNQHSIRGVLNWAAHYYRYKVHGIALPTYVKSFEEEVREALQKLSQDLFSIKQILQTIVTEEIILASSPLAMVPQDQDLVGYIDQQRDLLEQDYYKPVIVTDNDDIGKMMTIVEAFRPSKKIETDYLRIGKRKLPEHLWIKMPTHSYVIGFLQTTNSHSFASRLENFNTLVLRYQEDESMAFVLYRDERLPEIKNQTCQQEIEKLNHSVQGKFRYLDKEKRIGLELIYKLIIDVQNQDVEVSLEQALNFLEHHFSDYWLIQIFQR